jgi:hypothetical protein
MSLTCEVNFDGDCEWYYDPPKDFTTLDTKISRKCCSCGCHIKVGSLVLKYRRWHSPRAAVQERIFGDEVPMSNKYMCKACGDLALNLNELGYCTPPGEDMRELVKEYSQL